MQKPSVMEKFVSSFKKDGVDHIRVGLGGETQLGRICSVEWRRRFFIPLVGEFLSPQCFANWLITGDEAARHDPKYRVTRSVRGYHGYQLFAKYYQLCSLSSQLRKEMKSLPFVSYKIHGSGIKEFDRWKEYPATVKEMIEHILDPERGPKVPFPFDPALKETIDSMIKAIAMASTDDSEPEATSEQPATEEAVVETVAEEAVVEEVQTEEPAAEEPAEEVSSTRKPSKEKTVA